MVAAKRAAAKKATAIKVAPEEAAPEKAAVKKAPAKKAAAVKMASVEAALGQAEPAAADQVQEAIGPKTLTVSERFQLLFDELHITKIVVVDDQLEKALDAALVTRVVNDTPEAAEAISAFFPEVALSADNQNLFEQVAAVLGQMDGNQLSSLSEALSAFDQEAADIELAQKIRDLAPAEFDIEPLTPAQWVARRDALLGNCSPTARTLFLFDQQLNGDEALGLAKGTQIIAGIAAEDAGAFGAKWFCGILSHTLDRGMEVATWRKLEVEEQLSLEWFMPISKKNLADREAFYGAVYRTLINTFIEKMKQVAKVGFETALDKTLQTFVNLDPIDFEHMIVKSSGDEGVSELESLLRLYSIVQKDLVKAELLREEALLEFLAAARTVKGVVDVGRALPEESSKRLRQLRYDELYEAGELINRFHDPLRNGDLFEIGAPGSLNIWVLIAQPCDLMVRKNGERSYEKIFKVAVLAPVKRGSPGEPPPDKPGQGYMLDHFDRQNSQAAFVSFANATPVNLNVLDLSVLSAEGRCELDALATAADVKFSSTAWDERAKQLRKTFKKITNAIEEGRANGGDDRVTELALYLAPQAAPTTAFRRLEAYDKGKFIYKVRRIGRVRDPLATSLLAAFGRYISRDAHEHDFSTVRPG